MFNIMLTILTIDIYKQSIKISPPQPKKTISYHLNQLWHEQNRRYLQLSPAKAPFSHPAALHPHPTQSTPPRPHPTTDPHSPGIGHVYNSKIRRCYSV